MATKSKAAQKAARPRRQWGAESSDDPMSILHERPSARKIMLGRVAILTTILAWFMYVLTTVFREIISDQYLGFRFTVEAISYLLVVTFLSFSALMYLLARQGALNRFRDHVRVPRAELDRHFSSDYREAITVLIPSYVEELGVISNTIWSAALQEFPNKRIVLLIDDPPNPSDPERIAGLAATRALPGQIMQALAEPAARLQQARDAVVPGLQLTGRVTPEHLARLIQEYDYAAHWLETQAADKAVGDHMDAFFVDRVLMGLASDLRLTVLALGGARDQGQLPSAERIIQLHNRLAWIFTAEITSFERKQYASLSQEANKAMNLNAYISLMGRDWSLEHSGSGDILVPSLPGDEVHLSVPDTTYLLTLDADSMLLRDYCVRLVYLLEEKDNERVAVTQTPYSSYRGAPTRIERLAGATTDVQHILHQGMSYYNATFWVGANAVIRKAALNDIVQVQTVGGYQISTYIQDRTVIEDTESSIDLGSHDWSLVNYPERLSYSATPPDFGSLIVQRRRWANGGLLILPKFNRQVRERRFRRERVLLRESLLRINYMASIAWASLGLIFLLAYPYDSRLLSLWVVLAALPYFACMASDLRDSGHRASDVFRIYGFNLILLAVNVSGVLKSLQQGLTNEKIPFARTPKVKNRTAAPGLFVLVPWLIVAFSLLTFWRDIQVQNWGNAAFALTNAVLCLWAIMAYIGVWNSIVDMVLGVVNWLYVPERSVREEVKAARAAKKHSKKRPGGPVDWQSILYYGDRRLGRDVKHDNDLRRRASPR